MDVDGSNKRVFQRLGWPPADSKHQKVSYNWQAGKCTRHPCLFLHGELPHSNANGMSSKRPHGHGYAGDSGFQGPRRNPNFSRSANFSGASTWGRAQGGGVVVASNKIVRKTDKVCNYWV